MAGRLTPPIFPLRPADDSSKFLAKDLIMAYPMLDRGDVLKNYGSWGPALDLDITGATYSRNDGIATLDISAGAMASKTGLNMEFPGKWSYAFWVKIDAAPVAEELNIFRFQGLTEGHVRAWVDFQGIWSWQKYSTADAYSILPASTFPTSRLMLVIGVYGDNFLPPAQLLTNQGFTTPPEQPLSYAVYNSGQGVQASNFRSFYLGNEPAGIEGLKGSIGPVYIWSRAITLSEIWQLWKDPYAPFRRSMEQQTVPSTMVSFSEYSLEGIGKATSPRPLFQDDNAITIYVQDYHQYVAVPIDMLQSLSDTLPNLTINVTDSYSYQALPADVIVSDDTGIITNLEVVIADSVSFVALPTENMESEAPYSLITVTINDSIAYQTLPTDTFIADDSYTITSDVITVTDSAAYQVLPTEDVTGS